MNNLVRSSRLSQFLSLCLLLIFLFSCSETENKKSSQKHKKQIEYSSLVRFATNGNISASSELIVEFTKKIELLNDGGDIIKADFYDIQPKVEGKFYWRGKSSIAFVPEKGLVNGTDYHISLKLSKLFELDKGQKKNFSFDVSVIPLRFYIQMNVLSSNAEENNLSSYISGKMIFSDKVDYETAKTLIGASQNNNELEITFGDFISDNSLEFKINGIQRLDDESIVLITWDGKKINSKDSGSKEISVSAKDNFEFVDIKAVDSPTQYVQVSFSDPIDKSLNLKGIIYISESPKAKYIIEGNKVLMYPEKHLIGDINVVVNKEIRSKGGKNITEKLMLKAYFGQLKPAVRFIDDGVILPSKSNWRLTFEAVNLLKVDVVVRKIFANNVKQFMQRNSLSGHNELDRVSEIVHTQNIELIANKEANNGNWNAYELDLEKFIKGTEAGIYRVQIKFKNEYALYECKNPEVDEDDEYSYYQSGDYLKDEYFYPKGFQWYKKDDPCSKSYYYYEHFIQKNIVPSSIGLTLKGSESGEYTLFATNLNTAQPIGGLKISIFNYQQQQIDEITTDNEGVAKFKRENEPWLIVANKGGEFSYLKIGDVYSLSYSRFNTKGVKLKDGLKAYIYGDRGVWRPGDTLFLTMMLEDINDKIPELHPASVELYNPLSKLVSLQKLTANENGFYSFKITTSTEDITGLWIAKFRYGGSEFSKRLRIENLKPNRLKINLSIDNETLIKGDNKASIKVKWLHGGIADKLKTTINATIKPIKTTFENFSDYNFDDVGRYFAPDELVVLDSELDSKGDKSFNVKLPDYHSAPGELKVSFVSKVFEKGGDFSIDQINKLYSPYDYYIGLKKAEDNNESDYLEVDKPHKFNVVTVDEVGNPLDIKGLQVEVYRISWSWWYGSGGRSASRYINKDYYNRVYQTQVNTKNGKADFDLNISYPDWGRFYVNVYDPDNGHSTGSIVYFDWPSWYSRENRKGADDAGLLSLTTDKDKYFVGDTVKISLPTGDKSNMLVSLESDTKLMKYWWQESTAEESLIKFVATKEMSPNIYAYISVIQPFGLNVNDVPIRKYGLVPIMVEDKESILKPKIEMDETIRPNSKYNIKVSEENNKKMTYTIAVVDEGLLDLTHFITPDPHSAFYAKQALFVQTWDIFNEVMSAFKGKISHTFAIGGSDEAIDNSPEKKKANRFKAVVSYLGPFTLEPGETAEHQLLMQNYIGSVRVMLIAGNQGAYGHTDKTVSVKQPLMVLATLPRVLAPGERLKVPVSVFVLDEKIKNVDVGLSFNDIFICKKNTKSIKVDKIGEKNLEFDVIINEINGIGKIKVEVSSGNETAFNEVEIQVRNPNPRVYNVDYKISPPSSKFKFNPEIIGQKGTRELNINFSVMPQINLERRLRYLIHYPYGCVEQTTSSVFPQLYLNNLAELSDVQKTKTDANIKFAINKLLRMQLNNGGFSYWQNGSYVSDWGTSYAGHFLIMAKEKGYFVPHAYFNSWIEYQTKAANNWNPVTTSKSVVKNDLGQAYRLFTLALAEKPNISAMNRLREMKELHPIAEYELAASYALVGQIKIAKKLIENIKYNLPENTYWYYNYGSELRDRAMIINALVYIDREKALPIALDIAKDLTSNNWYSTQTTAFSLMALSQFFSSDKNADPYSFNYTWAGENSGKIEPDKPVYSINPDIETDDEIMVENTGEREIFVSFTTSGIPKMGVPIQKESNIKLDIAYKDMNGNIIDPQYIKQGTDFYAKVKITSDRSRSMRNLALTQIFPSGWEIINTRMFDLGSELKSDKADYVDFRDDRVNFFFDLPRGMSKTFIVLLNASYKGSFYLPATICNDMYNKDIEAVKGGSWINVE